jgi:hypothetical protein
LRFNRFKSLQYCARRYTSLTSHFQEFPFINLNFILKAFLKLNKKRKFLILQKDLKIYCVFVSDQLKKFLNIYKINVCVFCVVLCACVCVIIVTFSTLFSWKTVKFFQNITFLPLINLSLANWQKRDFEIVSNDFCTISIVFFYNSISYGILIISKIEKVTKLKKFLYA